MNKLLQVILLIVLLAPLFGGCAGADDPMPETAVVTIVTYESTADGTALFTYTDGDGRLVTLTAPMAPNSDLKPGCRVLICYRTDQYGASGPVTLLTVTKIPGGEPKLSEDAAIPPSEALTQCVMWRSGNYVNMSSTVTFAGSAREVSLYVDQSTLALPVPTARVVVAAAASQPVDGVERRLYASWNLQSVFDAPGNEGLNILHTAPDGEEKLIEISR